MNHAIVISGIIIVIAFSVSAVMYASYQGGAAHSNGPVLLSEQDFIEQYKKHPNAVLVDIRTREEFSSGHIPGAVQTDYYHPDFIQNLKALAGDKSLFMYCQSGNRTSHAVYQLRNEGIQIFELEDGFSNYSGQVAR